MNFILPNPLIFAEVLTNSKIGKYRFRIGVYRVVFDLEVENIIMILDVDHRKDIYR
ncbi:type II toxin-antitoxin system RelE/ParE family toxin [Candidatus Daviesbacteria bacterium]|nr:type II toxin-antitoxin system RelE/ParE family toxin [Candidatus Daviesbacteria bacterium]